MSEKYPGWGWGAGRGKEPIPQTDSVIQRPSSESSEGPLGRGEVVCFPEW